MKRTVAKITTAVVATTLSLGLIVGIGEILFRGILGVSVPYEMYRVARFHERLGWRLIPGDYEFFHPSAFTAAKISINELGIRNAPVSMPAPADRRRVSVVGDSFVFAAALSEGHKFTDRLQERVGTGFEIVNVSAPGYGTGQQILLLETLAEEGYAIGDTVILTFYTNDILDNVGRRYGAVAPDLTRPAFGLENGRLVQLREPVDPVAGRQRGFHDPNPIKRSLFLSFLKKRGAVAASHFPGLMALLHDVGLRMPLRRTPGIINGWYRDDWEQMWAVSDALLERLADTVTRLGANRLIVAFLPSPFQVEPIFSEVLRGHSDDPAYAAFLADMGRPQAALLGSCERHGIECIDLFEALDENRGGEPAYFLREGHLNAHGSQIVANALHDALLEPGG